MIVDSDSPIHWMIIGGTYGMLAGVLICVVGEFVYRKITGKWTWEL
jgi:hypothetical protein